MRKALNYGIIEETMFNYTLQVTTKNGETFTHVWTSASQQSYKELLRGIYKVRPTWSHIHVEKCEKEVRRFKDWTWWTWLRMEQKNN